MNLFGDIDNWTGIVKTIYGGYTVTQRDRIVCCGKGIVECAVVLPPAALVKGFPFLFYYISPDTLGYAVTISPVGSERFIMPSGLVPSLVVHTEGDYLITYSDGIYWHVLGYVNLDL